MDYRKHVSNRVTLSDSTMKLPEKYSDEYKIDYDKDVITPGVSLYYAPDGVIHRVTDSSPMSFELYDTHKDEYWEISGLELRGDLFTDFFPLKIVGHYPY